MGPFMYFHNYLNIADLSLFSSSFRCPALGLKTQVAWATRWTFLVGSSPYLYKMISANRAVFSSSSRYPALGLKRKWRGPHHGRFLWVFLCILRALTAY